MCGTFDDIKKAEECLVALDYLQEQQVLGVERPKVTVACRFLS